MYSHCIKQRSAERQRQMERVLLDEMQQKPYSEITVSSLCARMHIQRRTFYRYFDNKDGALMALIDHAILDCFAKRQYDGFASIETNIYNMFAYWEDHKELLTVLTENNLLKLLLPRVIELCRTEGGAFPHDLFYEQEDQSYIRLFLSNGVMSMVIQWHLNGYPQSAVHMAKLASRLVRQPFPDP